MILPYRQDRRPSVSSLPLELHSLHLFPISTTAPLLLNEAPETSSSVSTSCAVYAMTAVRVAHWAGVGEIVVGGGCVERDRYGVDVVGCDVM